MIRLAIGLCARLAIAAFFGFVGAMKAFAPVAMLAAHGAWTVHIPDALGRMVGWSEIGCALALLASLIPRLGRVAVWAAVLLGANQLVAATVHLAHQESAALPQNALLVGLLATIVWVVQPIRPVADAESSGRA